MATYRYVPESGRKLLACGVVGLTLLAASAGEASAQGVVNRSGAQTQVRPHTQAEAELVRLIAQLQQATELRRVEDQRQRAREQEDARYYEQKRQGANRDKQYYDKQYYDKQYYDKQYRDKQYYDNIANQRAATNRDNNRAMADQAAQNRAVERANADALAVQRNAQRAADDRAAAERNRARKW